MTNPNLIYWLAAFHTPTVGLRKLQSWLSQFPDIKALYTATLDEWQEKQLNKADFYLLQAVNWQLVEEDIKWATNSNHIITLEDDAYPPLLKDIYDPPFILFIRGDVTILKEKQLALVGTRHPTTMGRQNATWFAKELAQQGWVITSGLATGIDGASHQGALSGGGKTIAVFGTGMHHIYPHHHHSLATTIVEKGGALISEFPLAAPPHASHFPKRNRIISGLSCGVLVIEAALKSGSLITARLAIEAGREVFAIPGSIHQIQSVGCHHLIRQGAKLVEKVSDILEELSTFSKIEGITLKKQPKNELLTDKEQAILHLIGYEMTTFDVILSLSGLTMSECSSIILLLELKGYIQSVPGGVTRQAYQ